MSKCLSGNDLYPYTISSLHNKCICKEVLLKKQKQNQKNETVKNFTVILQYQTI